MEQRRLPIYTAACFLNRALMRMISMGAVKDFLVAVTFFARVARLSDGNPWEEA